MLESSPLFWLVSTQFVLYAVGWGLCSLLMREHRTAVAHWGVFMLLLGAGFVLVGERDDSRGWWAYVGSGILFTASYLALRRGLERFLRLQPNDRENLGILVLTVVALASLGPGREMASWRVVATYGLGALVFARTLSGVYRPMRMEFSAWLFVLLSTPAVIVVAIALERVGRQVFDMATPLELQGLRAGNRGVLYGYLVGAAMFNFGFTALLVERLVQSLRTLSQSDPLTGLLNRRALDAQLERAVHRARRTRHGVAVLAVDIDHFKRVNDTHGHAAGDAVLAEVARRLQSTARRTDAVARTGGEEFIVLMPDIDLAGAAEAAERLREAVAATPVALDAPVQRLPVTVSIGVARFGTDEIDAAPMLHRADLALYGAKAEGRDRVVTSPGADGRPAAHRELRIAA